MEKVFIVAAKRSPIGAFSGSLKDVHAAQLGAEVVKALLKAGNVPADKVDELICGNILSAGLGQGVGRQIAVKAGIPVSTCAYSLNMLCGSGMKAVMEGATQIKAGEADVVVAGGVESMSGAPYLLPKDVRGGIKMGEFAVKDHMILDALTDAFEPIHMGITAENIAAKHGITREQQDAFAWDSQQKAIAAVDAGHFDEEIVPMEVKVGREMVTFARDEYPNRKTNLEKLGTLRPAFKKDGTVTAGNASGINDGASFVLLASEKAVKEMGLKPLAEVVAYAQGGVEPNVMGLGPVPAIDKALKKAGMKLSQMERIELNEAFAAQSLGVVKELAEQQDLSEQQILDRTNLWGGAIALGHPVGASGNRVLVSLLHGLKHADQQVGLASLCIGGGMGTAIIVKRI